MNIEQTSLDWTEDEIKALLHFVHVPTHGTMDNRLAFASRNMKNFPTRPMFEMRGEIL